MPLPAAERAVVVGPLARHHRKWVLLVAIFVVVAVIVVAAHDEHSRAFLVVEIFAPFAAYVPNGLAVCGVQRRTRAGGDIPWGSFLDGLVGGCCDGAKS